MGKTTIKSNSVPLLSSTFTLSQTATLKNSIYDYDEIIIKYGINAQDNYLAFVTIPVSGISVNDYIAYSYCINSSGAWDINGVELQIIDSTHIKYTGGYPSVWNNAKIIQIYGIRNK